MERLHSLGHREKDLLVVAVLIGLATLFFANVLFTNEVLVSDNLAGYSPWDYYHGQEAGAPTNYESDTLLAFYPAIVVAKQTLSSGSLPLWNPYYLGGLPFLAGAPWLGFFYPLHVLLFPVDPLRALGYVSFIDLCLGGVFMYFYLRSIECSRRAALVGSVSFELGGFLLSNLTWPHRVSTTVWAPLMFLCVEYLLRTRRWVFALLGAFAVAMCILAGNMVGMAYIMAALGVYSAFRLFLVAKQEGAKPAMKCASVIVLSVCTGILLSAVQLIPTYEVSQFSTRTQVSDEDGEESGRHPLALGTMLVPDIFGNPVDRPWGRNVFAKNIPGTYGETSLYIGVLPLSLAIWALLWRRDRYTVFFGGLALVSVCIFLNTPLSSLLHHIPVFGVGRPVEAKVIWMLAAPVLVALGFGSLVESTQKEGSAPIRRASVALLISATAVILALGLGKIWLGFQGRPEETGLPVQWYLYNVSNFLRLALLLLAGAMLLLLCARRSMKANLLALATIGVIVADLAYFGWKLNPTREREGLYPEMSSVRFLQSDSSIYRVIRGPLSRKVFPPNSLAVYGISDVQGYSGIVLDYYVDFLNLVEKGVSGPRRVYSLKYAASLSSRLLDLLNVKYVITIAEPGEEMARLEQADPDILLVYDGEVKIYENKDVLPRAFVVASYKVLREKEEILDELTSTEFDPASYVVLEEEPEPLSARIDTPGEESSARILEYTPNRITVEVQMSSDGFLVLSDLYYGGWKAFVDGEERKVLKADYIFRAVQLGQGRHMVEFVFDPLSLKIGLSISVLTALAVGSLLAYALLSRKMW
jgi:hypothetical protein